MFKAAVFGWSRSDRFYKNGLFFFELGNTFIASHNHNKVTDTLQREKYNNGQLQNTASIGFGRGRIERVQDAQMALFILNDLAKQGLLSGPLSKDKAYAFATLITSINTRRLFDFRRKRIYELTQIDSFLRSSGLVTTTDIRHFTTVNDNWSLAINPYRLSGAAWYVRLKPSATYNHGNSKYKFGTATNGSFSDGLSLGLEPEVGYERYVAKSLKWQHNMGVSASYNNYRSRLQNGYYTGSSRSDNNIDMGEEVLTAKAFYGFGFFPNNRTQLSTDFSVTATRLHDRISTYYQLQPMLVVGTTYFLGYRTYLSGNLYLTYQWDKYKLSSAYQPYDRSLATSVSVAFSHILF